MVVRRSFQSLRKWSGPGERHEAWVILRDDPDKPADLGVSEESRHSPGSIRLTPESARWLAGVIAEYLADAAGPGGGGTDIDTNREGA